MASTYVNDLRLNEMATGDGSGTWGTTTNTNLELIAEAFSYGTEAITTNADTHTTTIADGASDPGRALYLKYTGTLDSACTITIGPNTVSKVWIIENGTSGSQNIIISQGSGANITIPAGDTKVVYSDGAGAGAAFFDAFANLKVTDPAQTNITSVGTLTGFTSTGIDDNATSTAITIDSSENVGIGTSSPDARVKIVGDDTESGITLRLDGGGVQTQRGIVFAVGGADYGFLNIPVGGGGAMSFGTGSAGAAAERMRIDSSGNLLVGKTAINTDSVGFEARAIGLNAMVRDGGETLVLGRNTSDGSILSFRKDGTNVGSIGSRSSGANLYIALRTETAGDGCGLTGSDSSTGAILPSDGNGATADNHIDLGAPAVRFKDLYLSGGAYLGGTGAANLLDDYEEGTWTPVLADAVTAGNTATMTADGRYTKIGRLITVECRMLDIDTTGMTAGNSIFIRGLPEAVSVNSRAIGSVNLDRVNFTNYVVVIGGASTSYALLSDQIDSAQDVVLTVAAITSTGSDISFTLQYTI
jgi:hypothetical protein